MSDLFSSMSDSAITASPPSPGGDLEPPPAPKKIIKSIKVKAIFCTGPWDPSLPERWEKLKQLMKTEGIKCDLTWWGGCEEYGIANEAHPNGYHHGHLVIVFANTTTIGKTNTPKIQRAISDDANWCIHKLKGNFEVRQVKLLCRHNLRFYS